MPGTLDDVVRRLQDPRVAWACLAVAVVLAGVVLAVHRGLTPAYTDYGQEGDTYTFPLNDKLGEEDGVTFYWARCGHNEFCSPIAIRGDPPAGASHVILKVPSRDPAAATTPLPEPVEAECGWRGDCVDQNATTTTVAQAWGPYKQVPLRWWQAAVGVTVALLLAAAANVVRGPAAAARCLLAVAAGVLAAAAMSLDGMILFLLGAVVVVLVAILSGTLAMLRRVWPPAARLAVALLWALLGWVLQSALFVDWFPGPPTM
jgi:hypothetical protein